MLEYIQFYTKNLSNLTILLVIGVVIAILDITIRNVVKGVYLNVRENMRLRHGDKREGMENEGEPDGEPNGEPDSVAGGDESCPKDCNAVEALRKKLTGLIENASKLQKDIQANNETIRNQHRTIEQMQKGIQKLTEKSAK
jgi:hypothetical protein